MICVCKLETQESQGSSSSLSPKVSEPGEHMSQVKNSQESEFALTLPFILFRASADWMGPALTRAIYITQSTNPNINLIQKHPHKYT